MLVEPMTQYKDFASNTKFKVFPLLNEGILVRKETLQCLLDALPSEYGLIVEFWKYSNSSYIFEAPRYLFLEESGKIVLSSNESIEKISMMLNMNVGMRDSRIDTASAAFIKGILLADEQKKDEVTIEEIKWIFKIIKIYKDLSDTDIIVATILVDKLLNAIQEQKQEGLESPLEIHRLPIGLLVLNCVILAEKILHDDLYRNSDYAKIFKMNVSDINLNEQQILHMLDFRINVSLECYEEYKQKISAL
jgi:hypothetical protein